MKLLPDNRAALGLILLYSLAVLVLLIRGGDPDQFWWWVLGFFFFGWVSSPIFIGLSFERMFERKVIKATYMAGVSLIGIVGFILQWHVLFVGPSDSQNALVLVFVPVYQLAAVIGWFVVAYFINRYVTKF